MEGPSAFALVFLFLSLGCFSNQMVPADVKPMAQNNPVADVTGNITACVNSRGWPGGCVERIYCNYNTSNIDLTVYGPPGYRDPCQGKGVCCPTEFILPATPPKVADDDKIDFGDDDD